MVRLLFEEDAHFHPVDGKRDIHEPLRLAVFQVETLADVAGDDHVGESLRGDAQVLILEEPHRPDAVLAVLVVQGGQDAIPVHTGVQEVGGHPEGAGID